MTINISRNILNLTGQRVNEIKLDEEGDKIVIHCSRDARRSTIDPTTGKKRTTAMVHKPDNSKCF